MKAVGYRQSLAISASESLLDLELPDPQPKGRDLLVQVKAISVNPVDTKQRMRITPPAGETNVLGYDAAGVVVQTGPEANLFKPGDEVWYAGVSNRPGSNAELELVDERIVGRKPASLSFMEAAALPLTAVTAWEMLFDRFKIARDISVTGETLVIIGAAGGVGSIMTQLARQLTRLTVIGTASRPETQKWVQTMGAHQVIDHHKPLLEELKRIGIPSVQYVAGLTQTGAHFSEIAEMLAPQGKFGLIDDPGPIDINLLKRKSITICWEFMFTRAVFQTADMARQGLILNEISGLVDIGKIRTTLGSNYGPVNAANLKRAHAQIESGSTIGKIVLEWAG
ncbi:MAG TPA: zinc-binding alcohol dehydrogenase family protein [Leptolinea sp.]